MTADDIRDIDIAVSYGTKNREQLFLREIAAQLAELNQNLRDVGGVIALRNEAGLHE